MFHFLPPLGFLLLIYLVLIVDSVALIYNLALAGVLAFSVLLIMTDRARSTGMVVALAFVVFIYPDVFSYEENWFARFSSKYYLTMAARQIALAHLLICVFYCLPLAMPKQPIKLTEAPRRPNMVVFVLATSVVALLASLPIAYTALLTFRYGRNAAIETAGSNLILVVAVLYGCSSLAYAARWLTRGVTRMVVWACLAWLLFCIFALGTRFLILFASVAILFHFVDVHDLNLRFLKRRAWLIGGVALMVFAAAILQRAYRDAGSGVQREMALYSGEGVVNALAILNQVVDDYGIYWGENHLMILLFWVPRKLWPDKPRFIENAFIDFLVNPGVSESYSAAFGLPGTGVADFGPLWFLCLPFYFLLLRALDRFFASHVHGPDQVRLLASFVPGIVFFMVRQISTPLAFLAGLAVLHFTFGLLARICTSREVSSTRRRSRKEGLRAGPEKS
jgi:hypothetical protein